MRIAISTGGGDAPGLNAVIRAVVLSAHHRGWRSYGIQRGYEACSPSTASFRRPSRHHPPGRHHPRHHQPRQSLPLRQPGRARPRDGDRPVGRSGGRLPGQRLRRPRLHRRGRQPSDLPPALVQRASGSLRTEDDRQRRGRHPAHLRLRQRRGTATEALDKVHSTAESHDRVMVVELMGRYAGWIALYSGLSGSADVILIPRSPDIEKVCANPRAGSGGPALQHRGGGRGCRPSGGDIELVERRGVGTVDRLGGIASKVARAIELRTGKETRTRAGAPAARRLAHDLRPAARAPIRRSRGARDRRRCVRHHGRAQRP